MSGKNPLIDVKFKKDLELINDFEIPSFDVWKAQVEKDLKGASYEKKLVTKTYEGIKLQPIYTKDNLDTQSFMETHPGNDNFLRGSSAEGYLHKSWDVNQEIIVADVEEFNLALHKALKNGQNCVNLSLDTATKFGIDADYANTSQVGDCGLSISGIKSLERALKGIDFVTQPLKIDAGFNILPFLSFIQAHFKSHNLDLQNLLGSITVDPLKNLVTYGNLPISLDFVFDQLKVGINWVNKNSPSLKVIDVSSLPYSNSGASAVQELAFSLSTAVFYLNELIERKVEITDLVNKVQFSFGVGTNYFMEIAKFRAARVLLTNIAKHFGFDIEKLEITINAKSSGYYQTNFDPYVNLLRSTTETFSAIMGGAESITTSPFDESLRMSDDFSRRIARNTQTILREESHLDQVIDPAGGSYYIEALTEEVAIKAWEIFQDIESKGGMLEALKSNFIQDSIAEISANRERDINKRKSVIVGTNMFADINEKELEEKKLNQEEFKKKRTDYLQKYRLNGSQEKHKAIIEKLGSISELNTNDIIEQISDAFTNGATLGEITRALSASHKKGITISKLNTNRASEEFEELRKISLRHKAQNGSYPKIFLANMGHLKDYKARADFSKGFFEVGGFQVIDSNGFSSIDDAVNQAIKSEVTIIVICSTDDKYPTLVPDITKKLKAHNKDIQVILAGYPKDQIEQHKKSGVDDFIFLGVDVFEVLFSRHAKLGGM